jgi:spore germination cell wall hydrolase CwlJ-like protein
VSDIDVLARTVVGEARGEGEQGMTDVACVVMNRVAAARAFIASHGRYHLLFGDGSPASACLAPWQFSCWNRGDPNRAIIEALDETKAIFRQGLTIAHDAVNGLIVDRTHGATHYFDKRMPSPPKWAEGHTACFEEGHHRFFKDV